MAYQGGPGGGYGQDPAYYSAYIQPPQQNQVPYNLQMNATAPQSNPTLPYQGHFPPNTNFNNNAYQANSFSPAISYASPVPTYPAAPPVQHTWHPTPYARTYPDTTSSQPAPKRQRIEVVSNHVARPGQVSSHPVQPRPAQMAHPNRAQATSTQSPNSTARTSHAHAQPKPLSPESDYKLLLPLAEEFFEAADNLGPDMAKNSKPETVQFYQKLIATGLSCLEASMKMRMPPRLEAKVIIRYATVLYTDTLNGMEAEVALSKGITLCERNHLVDLKYQMQYLLAKVMFKTSPVAAFKSLDVHIEEATACKHHSWVYALRFLRATLSWESGNPKEAHAGLSNLHKIAELSSSSDRPVYLAATLFQAVHHLQSGKPDSIERVQTAIAAGRAWQFAASSQIPQLLLMTHILDVCCSILMGVPSATVEKTKAMQVDLDRILGDGNWDEFDDTITIPLTTTQEHPKIVTSDTRAVLSLSGDGTEQLRLSWCDKRTMSAISYLLAGMTYMHKAGRDERVRKYLQEGLRVFSGNKHYPAEELLVANAKAGNPRRALMRNASELKAQRQWRDKTLCYIHVYLAFWHASRTEWAKLDNCLTNLKDAIAARKVSTEGPLAMIVDYISGVYLQGTGDLDGALQIFESDEFAVQKPKSIVTSADRFRQDVSTLAALNALWIYQEPSRVNASRNSEMLEKLEPLCQENRMADFRAALNLVKATIATHPPAPRIKAKNCLVEAMDIARKTTNIQFLCITLSIMSHSYFKDIVGTQAEKSSRAAAAQASLSGNKLWMSVADGVLASCLEIQQQLPEADQRRQSAIALARTALSKNESR